ncbi:hypothetical protein DPSP01_004938 [Paraphaeosphaeria sporulosa]|uniref:Uncharacterized protein n=1 Tax=Paraphaeosphaeria sporulosa TaxID=1460663 RepID=A0A177C6W1_9PLEO|nr:uncharacterized protein CC84DRAFT_964197 [Paraphaeosphaeria sporulosa]OAG03275.1 hypothetical protein CC84DRAFT_964197 [Paraphaeosphaeria sporulosa]
MFASMPRVWCMPGLCEALHLDDDTRGDNSLAFDPECFYANPKLQDSKAFRPFGGAARRTVGYFVSVLITRFDLAVDQESSSSFPLSDLAKPAAGIPLSQAGDDVELLFGERREEGR